MKSLTVLTKLQQIAAQALMYPKRVFITLMHLIDVDFLHQAFNLIRKDASPGVDKVTAAEYAENLEANLQDLYERMRGGRYRAPPVERAWAEKEDGKKRPLGKPTLEDKIVQKAVAMLLGAIYEHDFYDFSYGFRPGLSAHDALQALRKQCMEMNIRWIVDADISGFFDNIVHGILREIIKQRVNDGMVIRFIDKWLNAGVLEGGNLSYPETGTPQGGVISPILANIFLHHVLDEWFVNEVQPRMQGRCFIIRFADDFVLGFEYESDARRVMDVLPKRFERFKLNLHPQKTALIKFGKPSLQEKKSGNSTFDFLGFTHYWAKSRRGYWVIKRKTMAKRQKRSMKTIWQWCRNNRHMPLKEQYKLLCLKLRGHYQYYGITSNYLMLYKFKRHVEKAWRYWLSRRSHKGVLTWEKFDGVLEHFKLPKPRTIHAI